MKKLFLLAFCLIGCDQNPAGPDSQPQPRELGTLLSIYPIPEADGSFSIRLELTRDTVIVDLTSLQAYGADSLGKSIIRSTREKFYTENGECLYSRKKPDCLEFRRP